MFTGKGHQVKISPARVLRPINWIVSYPRSGNAFLRSLLANYSVNPTTPLTLDQISRSAYGEHNEKLLFQLTGKRPAERSIAEEMRARPAYFNQIRRLAGSSAPMVKSHTVNGRVEGLPTFKFSLGDRAIHIVRHPCDVAISIAHYYNMDIETAVERLLQQGAYYHGWPAAGYEVIGSWSQHTRGWMEETGIPVFRVRYDDLVARTADILGAIAAFLDWPLEEERIARAVEFSRFSLLQAEERKYGYGETADTAQNGYFRDGRPGQWLEQLTIRQAERILDHDPELIDILGFLSPAAGSGHAK